MAKAARAISRRPGFLPSCREKIAKQNFTGKSCRSFFLTFTIGTRKMKNGRRRVDILKLSIEYDELHEEVDNVLKKILRDNVPEVIICSNDVIAINALRKLKEWEYTIPEEINIVGFDDIPDAERKVFQH